MLETPRRTERCGRIADLKAVQTQIALLQDLVQDDDDGMTLRGSRQLKTRCRRMHAIQVAPELMQYERDSYLWAFLGQRRP